MALAGPPPSERQPSPFAPNANGTGLNLNLSSNNPFRNRAASPSPPINTPLPYLNVASTSAPSGSTSPRFRPAPPPPGAGSPNNTSNMMSKNPFLDKSEVNRPRADNGQSAGLTSDIFQDLSLLDKPNGPSRSGTLPPPYNHRPSGSDEQRRRAAPGAPRLARGPDSPTKRNPDGRSTQRARGLSESSVMDERDRERRRERAGDRSDRPPRTESEERRRRERRKEREERHRREKEKIRNGGTTSSGDKKLKKPQGLDIIDKLDVTGIYGQGLFHHDGPFDACNPHRNAKRDRRAPMQAFPAGSANMALGGSGPVRSRLDLDRFHGRGEEGFTDYAVARKANTPYVVNPTDRIEQVHGDETHGLGTSTFLEGAPASRAALAQRESEEARTGITFDDGVNPAPGPSSNGNGLTRKKSLVQRIRGMSASRGGYRPNVGGLRSPDARYTGSAIDDSDNKAISAGGIPRAQRSGYKDDEINPFDEYDAAFDKKGAQVRIAEAERSGAGLLPSTGRPRAPSSPKGNPLVRSVTADSGAANGWGREEVERTGSSNGNANGNGSSSGGGFLSRMRSLKGGPRRARTERRDT